MLDPKKYKVIEPEQKPKKEDKPIVPGVQNRLLLSDATFVGAKKNPTLFAWCEALSMLAKNLYNASLFRIRQIFFGWDKAPEKRSEHEKTVFAEIDKLHVEFPDMKVKKVISYKHLEKLMRVTKNPDFFAGLPMQTAQAVVKDAISDFKNWLSACKEYKKDSSKFLGKPKMPGYCKSPYRTFTLTNQDAVFYRVQADDTHPESTEMKLPLTSVRLPMPHMRPEDDLREVKVTRSYGRYQICCVVAVPFDSLPTRTGLAGLDLGVANIAALVFTTSHAYVYKGGAILSHNRLFAKKKASAVSTLTKGHKPKHVESRHLERLSRRHSDFTRDTLHKIANDIIVRCIKHEAGILVIGKNPLWKQNAKMSKRNNQNFVNIPHAQLIDYITYRAAKYGIMVVLQEESYTSKADLIAKDFMPVYGQENGKPKFSGVRAERGTYSCSNGLDINADCNGAGNILRKAIPTAWDQVTDYRFMATPVSIKFTDFMPNYNMDPA